MKPDIGAEVFQTWHLLGGMLSFLVRRFLQPRIQEVS